MNTIAWVLILIAGLMVRGMTKGRGITELPGDLADMFNALAGGDQTTLRSVLARTGGSQTATGAVQDNTIQDMPSTGSKADLVTFGKRLQDMGYKVSEHPSFGGVRGEHVKGSSHYIGEAIDVNADGFRGGEKVALDNANNMAKAAGYQTLWQVTGHYDHLHVAVRR